MANFLTQKDTAPLLWSFTQLLEIIRTASLFGNSRQPGFFLKQIMFPDIL